MARFLLDTNHASPLVALNHPLRALIVERMVQGDQFFITPNHLTEILAGLLILPRAKENLEQWQRLESEIGSLGFTNEDARDAAQLQVALRKRGRQLATIDAQIATVAIREDVTLLTTDGDFKQVELLRVENWLTALRW